MKTVIIVFALLMSFKGWGQVDRDLSSADSQMNLSDLSMKASRTFDNRYEGMKGSPMLIPFSEGSLTFKGNFYNVNQKKLGLDAVAGLLVMRESDQSYKVLNSEYVDGFSLMENGKERKFLHERSTGLFLEILVDEGFKLLAKRSKKIIKANYQGGFNAKRPYDEITDQKSEYFIITSSGDLMHLGKKKKSIQDGLVKVPAAQEYLVDNQHKFFKEEALTKALAASK